MTAKRLMINPYEFGSMSPYEFLNNTNTDSAIQTWPHYDWTSIATGTSERSFRIWEPGRMALSELGLLESDPDNRFANEQRVQGAKIHGIKGELLIKPIGAVYFDADTGTPVDLPTGGYYDLFSAPEGQNSANYAFSASPGYYSTAPLFITMYTGTFSVVMDGYDEGGTIDSGPFDDPDTLMSLDITNPTVLESRRMAWWAIENVTMPHRDAAWYNGAGTNSSTLTTWQQGLKKIPLHLSHDFSVSKSQVLWMHLSFGLVGTPKILVDTDGNSHRIAYRPQALFELHGSMLASPYAVK